MKRPFAISVALSTLFLLGNSALSCFASTGHIVFASNRTGNYDIYVMNPDGSGVVDLTNHPKADRLPTWSADGTKIAFRSNRDGNAEIYVMDADGSNVVRVTNDPAIDTSPSWTPYGTILFSSNRSGRFEIYEVNPDGTNLQHIDIDVAGNLTFPTESPEGHRIAFTTTTTGGLSDSAIWIVHPDGTHPMQLTATELVGGLPDWSPFGNRIAFSNNFCAFCDLSNIMMVNQGGNGLRPLTPHSDTLNDLQPRWSPDGTQIVFSRDDFIHGTEIWVRNLDGSGEMNISQNSAVDFEADWGP